MKFTKEKSILSISLIMVLYAMIITIFNILLTPIYMLHILSFILLFYVIYGFFVWMAIGM
jgi:hypothetical protein